MQTSVSVYLNGVALHEVAPEIVLNEVREQGPQMQRGGVANGRLFGQLPAPLTWGAFEVRVSFWIKSVKDYIRRAEVLQAVNAWAAGGGEMTLSYRPGVVLQVQCDQLPGMGYVRDWTGMLEMTFRAYAVPCWQDEKAASWTHLKTVRVDADIDVPGTMETPLLFNITNVSQVTVNTLQVETGGSRMTFEELGLRRGETLQLWYDDRGVQRLTIDGSGVTRDALGCRTVDSADDLMLQPGVNHVKCAGQYALTWQLLARGRYA